MPKASPLQPSFSSGEFSPRHYGRTDSERYKTGLATCLNYLPTPQGPVVRRPGFKFIAEVKNPAKPPALIPFQFSQTQGYVLEFGDRYIRFFTNEGQVVTSGTSYISNITPLLAPDLHQTLNNPYIPADYNGAWGVRSDTGPRYGEKNLSNSAVVSGSILELPSFYLQEHVADIKWAQKNDTIYLTHPNYPIYKLQRFGATDWKLSPVALQDGPYLPFNTLNSFGDHAKTTLTPTSALKGDVQLTTGPSYTVTAASINGNYWRITTSPTTLHFSSGDDVTLIGAGSGTSNHETTKGKAFFINTSTLDIYYSEGFVPSGTFSGTCALHPSLFHAEMGERVIGLSNTGTRYWGYVSGTAGYLGNLSLVKTIPNSSLMGTWQLGIFVGANTYSGSSAFSGSSSFPSTCSFHQNRLAFAGIPTSPNTIGASVTGEFENFQASGTSYVVSDVNALNFNLTASELNPIYWLKSDSQGMVAGALNAEYSILPSTQGAALTPTNFNAKQTSNFGSANADSVQAGNATLYLDKSSQKLREMNYYFQVNTYRSTDLSELSDHLTSPSVDRAWNQKGEIPIVWVRRTDGTLLSMVYGRDDVSLIAGWARHRLGGDLDSAKSAPQVLSGAVIAASSGTFDQLWITSKRFINNTTVVYVEALQDVFKTGSTKQEDSKHLDCSSTYNDPKAISAITIAGSCIVTANSHGFVDGDLVRIDGVVGLNSSTADINGLIFNSNLVNGHVYRAGSTSTNAFFLQDRNNGSSYVDSRGYSVYVSGGAARKMVSTISGLTWLKNETVNILTDGGIHPTAVVNSAGVVSLEWDAAKVQIGYDYNSDMETLRLDAGSGDGSAIGKIRRPSRAAIMIHEVGQISIGTDFNRLTPLELNDDNLTQADAATPLVSGIVREGLESEYDFEGQVCIRQNGGLPGMIQSITTILEENDV